MTTGWARALDKVVRIAAQPRDVTSLWDEVDQVLDDVIPHYGGGCFYTVDPASLLMTSHFNRMMPTLPPESLAMEYYADDVNQIVDVARSTTGVSTLHDATAGEPASSPRWHANLAMGGDQELIAALRTRSGETWGALGLYREAGQPMFDSGDLTFVAEAAPHLAAAVRRGLLVGEASDPEGPDAPGLLVVNDAWQVESSTPGSERILANLADGGGDRLPASVLAVAARAMRAASHGDHGEVALSRVLDRSGNWVVLHGAPLTAAGGSARVAVIVEPAHPARIAPLLMAAYGLTPREQEVTRLVLCGASTTEVADALFLSPHTVQQHLTSVFDKTGVRSRRDLVGRVFFSHYEPRLRDNEQRVLADRPVRGGPATPTDLDPVD